MEYYQRGIWFLNTRSNMFRQQRQPHGPKAKVAGGRKTRPVVLKLSASAIVAASLLVLLIFTIALVYSYGVHHIYSTVTATSIFQRTFTSTNQQLPPYPYEPEFSITCNATAETTMAATCPANYYPPHSSASSAPSATCPEYFRWIHEDMKPWKKHGITIDMLDNLAKYKKFWRFRLVIVNGTAYVRTYGLAFRDRDIFTLWGINQLLRRYPGRIPDLDLVFHCADKADIRERDYEEGKAPPLFHYCGSDDTIDIVFPDWSFWGWPDTNIRPWAFFKKDLDAGNKMVKWTDREPYAFWRGNLEMGDRKKLTKCNSTTDWNTIIHQQDWRREARAGFKNSDLSKQCTHRYKIYVDGIAWSVSRKYILACDSMTLFVTPFYYDFYTRGLVPLKHYWPIDPNNLCESVKSAVDWGNKNPDKAQEIGRQSAKFIQEQIQMDHVYDYMFHLFTEYGKLFKYKPTIPAGARKLCTEDWFCPRNELARNFKMESIEPGPATDEPCTLPPPFEESEIEALKEEAAKGFKQAKAWEGEVNTKV